MPTWSRRSCVKKRKGIIKTPLGHPLSTAIKFTGTICGEFGIGAEAKIMTPMPEAEVALDASRNGL